MGSTTHTKEEKRE
ncbi:hypothetical protein MTR67_016418 [Solanum verrucosum]|nr:hypothetical protein MTR67_016418 [Solanum verrucosum]